jgi:hypothetical protein
MDRTRIKIPVDEELPRFEPRDMPNNPLALDTALQEACNWCWAAVTSHINNLLSPQAPFTQCEVVKTVLDNENCCAQPVPGPCDVRNMLSPALTEVGQHFLDLKPPDDQFVIDQVSNGFPPGVRIEWQGSGAVSHFVALYGFVPAQQTEKLKFNVADPVTGPDVMDADTFRNNYQSNGTWQTTYRTK